MSLLSVLVQTPVHSQVAGPLTYRNERPIAAGTLVRVPLGKRDLLGVIWDRPSSEAAVRNEAEISADKLRPIAGEIEGIAPLSVAWRQLVSFTADYYQRSLGEVALAALPPQLRELTALQVARRIKRYARPVELVSDQSSDAATALPLTAEQQRVIGQFNAAAGPFLLFGATGSGKTEV